MTTVYDRLFVHFAELKVIVCYITKMLHKKKWIKKEKKDIIRFICLKTKKAGLYSKNFADTLFLYLFFV